eukprot:scaffold5814_cov123-Isochrysis_galbana.AAC.1
MPRPATTPRDVAQFSSQLHAPHGERARRCGEQEYKNSGPTSSHYAVEWGSSPQLTARSSLLDYRSSLVHVQEAAALHVDRVKDSRVDGHKGHLDPEPVVEPYQAAAAQQGPSLV